MFGKLQTAANSYTVDTCGPCSVMFNRTEAMHLMLQFPALVVSPPQV